MQHSLLHEAFQASHVFIAYDLLLFALTAFMTSRIQNIMQYLRQHNSDTELILMAILPRADLEADTGAFQWPNKYTKAMDSVNSGLKAYAEGQTKMHYLDCTKQLVPDGTVSS